jgi:hypothetical protein
VTLATDRSVFLWLALPSESDTVRYGDKSEKSEVAANNDQAGPGRP